MLLWPPPPAFLNPCICIGAGILDRDGNPWFIAADVYRILEITNTTGASTPTERENPP